MTDERILGTSSGLNRRTVLRGAAWSVPAVTVAAAAPAYATSGGPRVGDTVPVVASTWTGAKNLLPAQRWRTGWLPMVPGSEGGDNNSTGNHVLPHPESGFISRADHTPQGGATLLVDYLVELSAGLTYAVSCQIDTYPIVPAATPFGRQHAELQLVRNNRVEQTFFQVTTNGGTKFPEGFTERVATLALTPLDLSKPFSVTQTGAYTLRYAFTMQTLSGAGTGTSGRRTPEVWTSVPVVAVVAV